MDDDDEDYSLISIGFMFDANHSRCLKIAEFDGGLSIKLRIIGEDPGHVQSGQYLWPAATDAAKYLISNWDILQSRLILELGAGCGLAGIVSGRLSGTQCVYLTDYDHGSLQLLEENAELNKIDGSCGVYIIKRLEWGCQLESFTDVSESCSDGFGLIVGTDLLYSVDIVVPLLLTVRSFLADTGVFLLVSSFDVGEDIERIFIETSASLGLTIEEIKPLQYKGGEGNCRVQHIVKGS